MALCLPEKMQRALIAAFKDGTITPAKLLSMTSGERHKLFLQFGDEEHARDLNAELEKKLILKNQQRGLVNWAKQAVGVNDAQRSDMIDKINKMEKVLAPAAQKDFLADLAAQKLGTAVNATEAKQILDLAKVAQQRRSLVQQNPTTENITAFGYAKRDLTKTIEDMKPATERPYSERLIDVWNAPKTLKTGILHFSLFGVQMWGVISSATAMRGFGQMFRYFASESNYQDLLSYMVGHPKYPTFLKGGLSITRLSEKLSEREETFQSSLFERFNQWAKDNKIVPINAFKAASRAYTGAANYMRFQFALQLTEAAELNGEDVSLGSKNIETIMRTINNHTGRGELGTFGLNEQNAVLVNAIFFSPRKLAATVQMFNPRNYLDPNISATARQFAFRQMIGSLIATGTFISLAHMAGAKIDLDPRSTDFMKPQIGGVKYDMTGGNAIWLRLLARLGSNQEVTSKNKLIELGQGFAPETRGSLILKFTRDKLEPSSAALADWLFGLADHQPWSTPRELYKLASPIPAETMIDFFHSNADHSLAALPALSSVLGYGAEIPQPPVGKYKYTIWGQDNSKPWEDRPTDPVDEAYANLGLSPGYPSQTLRGVKLSEDDYEKFIQSYGQETHKQLARQVAMRGFTQLPAGTRQELLRAAHERGSRIAEAQFIGHNLHFMRDMIKAKQELRQKGSTAVKAEQKAARP